MCSAKHMCKHLQIVVIFLVVYERLILVALSQDQSGFISIDCGSPENSTYTEADTKLSYVSDVEFVRGGESKVISPEYSRLNKQRHVLNLRSFPEGTRNCYTISTEEGTMYLIRATFLYGNYDAKKSLPKFDLHIGPNFWDTVDFVDAATPVVREVIHSPARDYARVCLANTGFGTPFMSALEFRPLNRRTYQFNGNELLRLFVRYDVGSITNESYRYPYDVADRIWSSYSESQWTGLSTSETVRPDPDDYKFLPPNVVMNSAVTPANESAPLVIKFVSGNVNTKFYVFLHCAEIQRLEPNESRAFNVSVNKQILDDPHSPRYLLLKTIWFWKYFTGEMSYVLTLDRLENSTLPPILNAFEIYNLAYISMQETDENEVEAIGNLKSVYGVKRNWDGDPCLPVKYSWAGLKCSINDSAPSRITSLDLSSSKLTGEISLSIGDLKMLESLDLSNNNLTGQVPQFLTQLPNLRVLNLRKNNLSGVLPDALLKRRKKGSLSLSIEENQHLCSVTPCKQKKRKNSNNMVPIGLSVCGSVLLLALAAAIFLVIKKKRNQADQRMRESNTEREMSENKVRKFSYPEIGEMTNNFETVLGKGGFATVYYGVLKDETKVAVKMSHSSSAPESTIQSEGRSARKAAESEEQYQLFQAEYKLLLTVHHRNLTSLVGYCNQGFHRALVYEYMANGDLESHLSGGRGQVLSWERRLQIAIDSAQGLEYLHRGCKPSIIHRDIKPANILISENYEAKLADFGFSKFFLTDDATHLSTMHIVGTPGYFDPDLANNGPLNEKSDVYSFGVVLLQIITGRPVTGTVQGRDYHLSQWVSLVLENGNVNDIVDSKLRGVFETNSALKFVEIAMSCVSLSRSERPTMNRVVTDLREYCSPLEQARTSFVTANSKSDIQNYTTDSEYRPLAQ